MALTTSRFALTGLHCPSCSMLIQMEVGDLPGVSEVTADHRSAVAEVTYDPDATSPDDIVNAVLKAGYGAELLAD